MGRESRIKKSIPASAHFHDVPSDIVRRSKQIPRDVLIQDMKAFIAQMPLSEDNLHILFDVIRNRLPSKSCVRCGIFFALKVEGNYHTWKQESLPLCRGCEAILREKGQIE